MILLNRIKTPDGTILISRHRHDYVEYTDANGLTYMTDGGNDYLRRTIHPSAPYEDMSLYDTSPWEEVRQHVCRGGRGKDGKQPLTWTPLCEMSDAWLWAVVEYNTKRGASVYVYDRELDYRRDNGITIDEG